MGGTTGERDRCGCVVSTGACACLLCYMHELICVVATLFYQAMLKGHYDRMLVKVEAGQSPVEYGEHLLACLKQAFAAVSWEKFQEEIAARPWTVCQVGKLALCLTVPLQATFCFAQSLVALCT